MLELSVYELDNQYGELLPEREALGLFTGPFFNNSFNTSVAFNVGLVGKGNLAQNAAAISGGNLSSINQAALAFQIHP
jgi:hypothetical protein